MVGRYPGAGGRPHLVLSRQAAIPFLNAVLAVPATRTIRGIATEVRLGGRGRDAGRVRPDAGQHDPDAETVLPRADLHPDSATHGSRVRGACTRDRLLVVALSDTSPRHAGAACRPGPARHQDIADEERVCPGRELVSHAALEPPERSLEQRKACRVANSDSFPHPDRRHAAGEVLRERLLTGGEQRERALAGLPQQLVERRLACDCHADERRLEGERDERCDGQPYPLPARVDRDHRDAGRHAPEHLP